MGTPEYVISVDIQEAENRLVFGVLEDADLSPFKTFLDSIGIPCDLVRSEVTGPIVATGDLADQ